PARREAFIGSSATSDAAVGPETEFLLNENGLEPLPLMLACRCGNTRPGAARVRPRPGQGINGGAAELVPLVGARCRRPPRPAATLGSGATKQGAGRQSTARSTGNCRSSKRTGAGRPVWAATPYGAGA